MLTLTVSRSTNGIDNRDNSQRRTIVQFTGVVTGDYTEGGETVNWATSAGSIPSSEPNNPVWVEVYEAIPSADGPIFIPALYNYATNKIQFYVSATGDELAAGAYSASFTGATFAIKAEFVNG